jgi:4-hydroxy-tetrahydrodipicolinate synthase
MGHGLTPTMKASLKILGMSAGDPYPPHPPIGGDDLKALEAYLKTTDFFVK